MALHKSKNPAHQKPAKYSNNPSYWDRRRPRLPASSRANSLHEALRYLPTLAFTRSRIAGHVSELVVLVLFGGGRRGRLRSQYDGCCIN